MADFRIVDASVVDALDAIKQSEADFKDAGEAFVQEITSAIAEMEGEIKDAWQTLIDGDVKKFVEEGIPEAILGMWKVLDANRTNITESDLEIAKNIGGEG